VQLLTHPAEMLVSEGIVVHMSPGEGYRPTKTDTSGNKASSDVQSSTDSNSDTNSKSEHDAAAAAEAAAVLQAAWASGIAAIATPSTSTTATAAISSTTGTESANSGFHSLSRWSSGTPSTTAADVKSSSTSNTSSSDSAAAKRKRRWQQALTELTVAAESAVTACNWHGIEVVHAGPGLLHINGLSNMKTRYVLVSSVFEWSLS
jgi:hypothetical protein